MINGDVQTILHHHLSSPSLITSTHHLFVRPITHHSSPGIKMNKVFASPEQAVADICDGATIAIAGFSVGHRFATSLILALREKGTKELCLVCNSLGDPARRAGKAENEFLAGAPCPAHT